VVVAGQVQVPITAQPLEAAVEQEALGLLLFLTHQHIHWQQPLALTPKQPLVVSTSSLSLVLEPSLFKKKTWHISQK
jgi:hypothetical protein